MDRVTVTIEGMSCQHCVKAVRGALETLPGVRIDDVAVGSATVTLDPAHGGTPAVVEEAVRDAGYDVTGVRAAA